MGGRAVFYGALEVADRLPAISGSNGSPDFPVN